MTYSIYTITHKETGRTYVGVTRTPKLRWSYHQNGAKHYLKTQRSVDKSPIMLAMAKNGIDQFEFKVVETTSKRNVAAALEDSWIWKFRDNSYNACANSSYRRRPSPVELKTEIAALKKQSPQ